MEGRGARDFLVVIWSNASREGVNIHQSSSNLISSPPPPPQGFLVHIILFQSSYPAHIFLFLSFSFFFFPVMSLIDMVTVMIESWNGHGDGDG